jgi:1,4-alpha-glucan branching enzyme
MKRACMNTTVGHVTNMPIIKTGTQSLGTRVFDYGRNEVRSFLISNALFWLTNIISTDFGSTPWRPCCILIMDGKMRVAANKNGGKENLERLNSLKI